MHEFSLISLGNALQEDLKMLLNLKIPSLLTSETVNTLEMELYNQGT